MKNKPGARTRRQSAAELEEARAEVNRLRAAVYQHPGKNGRTLATAADIDNLLADTRRALLNRLETVGTIPNAMLLLQCDIV